MKIVATTSLPAVDRPNADRWNAARSCQNCPVLRQNIKISGSYNQIFDTSVSIEVVQTLSMIDRFCDENSKLLSQKEANSTEQL